MQLLAFSQVKRQLYVAVEFWDEPDRSKHRIILDRSEANSCFSTTVVPTVFQSAH